MASGIGKVVSLNLSDVKGVKKNPVPQAVFQVNHGLLGDAHAGAWHRQVSLLSTESIEKMRKLGLSDLSYGSFAENITTEGLILHELAVGTRLQIGETIQEVTQIGKECHNTCAIKTEVGHCVMPTEGIFTKVLQGGAVHLGDLVKIL